MRNQKFVDMARLFKVEPQKIRAFHVDQIERCRELLIEAAQNATKDKTGKPVFYTALRRKTRSGKTQAFSIHYFDEVSGEMHSLNYVTAILLGLRLDSQARYVIVATKKHRCGNSLIYGLSTWIELGKRQSTAHITPLEL